MHLVKIKGFTLIELMVAVSIFVIVALIVSGALVTLNRVNQKAQAIKRAIDNVDFALTSMTLKMSQGYSYQCLSSRQAGVPDVGGSGVDPCPAGGEGVRFRNRADDKVFIYQRSADLLRIEYWESGVSGFDSFVPITRPDVRIEDLRFYVSYEEAVVFPRVEIAARGQTSAGGRATEFAVQTAVSQR